MNKIHNSLGPPGSLSNEKDSIGWVVKEKKKGNQIRHCSVPVVKAILEPSAMEIWTKYFELLFFHYNLLDRFKNHSEDLKKYAGNFYKYLFSEEKIVNKDKLLMLLMCDPRENPKWTVDDTEEGKKAIASVFNYEYLTEKYREKFAEFIQALDVNVCPYCGRSFTTTVKKRKGGIIRTNQVDHYYPKSKRPWLALSIWNLIPSCSSCNNWKRDDTNPFLYPYTEEMGDVYRFRTRLVKGVGYLVGVQGAEKDFEITIEAKDQTGAEPAYFERAKNEIDKLSINDLYSTHKGYVCDIFRQRYIFGDPYIDDLASTFPNLFRNREDVRTLLYMKRFDAESIGGNPLDKLTRDIDYEIDQLTEGGCI